MGRPRRLTPQEEKAIRKALDEGARVADVARQYGVGNSTLTRYLPDHRRRGPRVRVLDLAGETYGQWTVLERVPRKPGSTRYSSYFLCRCSCGDVKEVRGASLVDNHSRSCLECAHDRMRKNPRRSQHE